MQLPHLALTVVEDPGHDGFYHWLLLRSAEDGRPVEHSASDQSFSSIVEAFSAGTTRWIELTVKEDEDAEPVGDNIDP